MPIFRRVLAALTLVAILGISSSSPTPAQAPLTGQVNHPQIGEPVSLADPVTGRNLEITVTESSDSYGAMKSTRRGFRLVAFHLVAKNKGPDPFAMDDAQFLLVDDAGIYAFNMAALAYGPDMARYSPLMIDGIAPGKTIDGWLVFQISLEARPAALIFSSYDNPPYFGVLSWIDPVGPDAAGAIPILETSGAVRGVMTVAYIVPNFERTDPGIDPVPGLTTLGLVVSVTNQGTETWELEDDQFWVVDQYGYYSPRVVYDRNMDSYRKLSDLGFRARPGETVQGVLMFEMLAGSDFRHFLYIPNNDQLFFAGDQNSGTRIAAENAAETVHIKTRITTDAGCTGTVEWAEGSRISMEVAASVLEDITSDNQSITAEDLRDGAESVLLVMADQKKLIVPEKARTAQEKVIVLLDETATALQAAADRIDAGEAVKSVVASLDAPKSPVTLAANDAVRSLMTLFDDCSLELS